VCGEGFLIPWVSVNSIKSIMEHFESLCLGTQISLSWNQSKLQYKECFIWSRNLEYKVYTFQENRSSPQLMTQEYCIYCN